MMITDEIILNSIGASTQGMRISSHREGSLGVKAFHSLTVGQPSKDGLISFKENPDGLRRPVPELCPKDIAKSTSIPHSARNQRTCRNVRDCSAVIFHLNAMV